MFNQSIELWQAILIGLFAYLGSFGVPWALGHTGGWYTLSRPLVSGFIIGLILGDVHTGVIVGVAVQAVYIALVTPGGTMPQDLNFVAYPAVALGIISVQQGGSLEVAVTLATAMGALGTILHNAMMIANTYWLTRAEVGVEEGSYSKILRYHLVFPQITNFILRFFVTILVVYVGGAYVNDFVNNLPPVVNHIFDVLGGVLPALGIGVLLSQVIDKKSLLLYFILGFITMLLVHNNLVIILIFGIFLAYIHVNYGYKETTPANTNTDDDDEEF